MVQCPRCGLQVNELHPLASEVILRLQSMGESSVPQAVCAGCSSDLRKTLNSASGSVLLSQERAKETHKLTLWKSRVNLIKKARMQMNKKMYGDAAVSYEKYVKILEMVFDVKKGETLKPSDFRDNARTTEITVVASVFWDLLRIYDTSDKYKDRQTVAAKQLAAFVRFSPIFTDIIRKAEQFQKTANNPSAVKLFLKQAQANKGRCFIATQVYGTHTSHEVLVLRNFRDLYLRNNFWGRQFIVFYYRVSPLLVNYSEKKPWLKKTAKILLNWLIKRIS